MASGQLYRRGRTWHAVIYTGRSIDGKPERVRFTTRQTSKAEARKILTTELYRYDKKSGVGDSCRLDFLLEEWTRSIESRIANEKTAHDYIFGATQIVRDIIGSGIFETRDLQPTNLLSIVNSYSLSTNTINKRIARLKNIVDYAVSNRFIATNPVRDFKYLRLVPVKHRRHLSDEEIAMLLAVSPVEFRRIWQFFLLTGLRASELTNLRWQNIDLKKRVIRVTPTDKFTVKTATGIRSIPLHAKIELPDRVGEYVFCNQNKVAHRPDVLIKAFKRCMFNALCRLRGLPYGKRLSKTELADNYEKIEAVNAELKNLDIHCLRYTFCTGLIRSGADVKTVQQLMGHKSPVVTLKIYAQFTTANAESAVLNLPYLND
ncbi:hypothetical protein AGMMS49959_19050 [Planctomycetales bacterium]|nr:hypothetical protein AGMMS49959_19050 [Planctomycetales bacterium]